MIPHTPAGVPQPHAIFQRDSLPITKPARPAFFERSVEVCVGMLRLGPTVPSVVNVVSSEGGAAWVIITSEPRLGKRLNSEIVVPWQEGDGLVDER
jgi:hypothetical protein